MRGNSKLKSALVRSAAVCSSRLQRSADPGEPRLLTLNDYVRYLRDQDFGLAGEHFYPEDYVACVAKRLGASIEIAYCDQDHHPDVYRVLCERGWSGMIMRNRGTADAVIAVRRDMPWSQIAKTIMHEAEHIVCGHYVGGENSVSFAGRSVGDIVGVCARRLNGTERAKQGRWKPKRHERLLDKEPPEDEYEAEAEAEKRAELGLKAAARGPDVYRGGEDWVFSRRI